MPDGPASHGNDPPPTAAPVGGGGALRDWIGALEAVKLMERRPRATLASLLEERAAGVAEGVALLGEGERLSFAELAAASNRVARWAIAEGLAAQRGSAGATVALLMPNRPDYVAIWLGLTRAGCAVALLNTNLTGDALMHSLGTSGASCLIVGAELGSAVAAVGPRLQPGLRIVTHGEAPDESGQPLAARLARHSAAPLDPEAHPFPERAQTALLIQTSGTTGLPKAVRITHGRILEWSLWFVGMMGVQPGDRLYDCLPLYHSTGGVAAIGAMLVSGGSVRIAKHFSARTFWDEVVDDDCTIFFYIGELCRYLLQSPPTAKEGRHRLRLAAGNGLHGSVWEPFRARFRIPRILEFYAATEGNVSLYNCEGKPGAIGRVPAFLARRFPVALIRVGPDGLAPVRDEAGRCVRCAPGEAGEAIGPVASNGAPLPARRFDGYLDPAATERKLLRDVFVPGDCWFRTGDLMRADADGFYYFVDRIGDTFRWKGENVSTTEVASLIAACPGVTGAVVYGVQVAGQEGRAGMAALTCDGAFDIAHFAAHVRLTLPAYAQPVFVRLCRTLDRTGTFKHAKGRLAPEGYDGLSDPVWLRDRRAGCYVPLTPGLLDAVRRGALRL